MKPAKKNYHIAIVGNQAFTLIRFRGPLIRALVAHGYSVYAFMPDATPEDRDAVRALGAEPVYFYLDRTGINPISDAKTAASLWSLFRQHRIDQVFCYFIKPVIYGLWAARLAGVDNRFALIEGAGTAFAEDAGLSLKTRALKAAAVFLYRSALRHADKVFFLNPDDRDLFYETGMTSASTTRVIPGIGIDLDEYRFAALPEAPPTFVMVTRLLGQKGVREYAEAARSVKRLCPEARFLLLGALESNPDGVDEAEVAAWVEEGVLEWPGKVKNVQAWLENAHVFVLPSYREGLPRSTMEAMAKGRPVITTDMVGCKETVEHERNGFLVRARDPESLAEAMLRFIDAPELVERMGLESRRLAEERFDVHAINQRFLDEMSPLH